MVAQLAGGVVEVFSNQRAFVALKGDQPLVTITMAYQWNRDGNPIAGETNSTYTLTQADVGKAITVTAGYTDGAGNPESVTSAVTTVDSEPALPAAWWASAEEATAGWRISSWFGAFRPYENGWIFHADLGWLYAQPDGAIGLWVWSKGKGWLWTNPGSYRYLYQADTHQWLYFLKRKDGQARFYNHATGSVE